MSLIEEIQSLDATTNQEFPYPFSLDVASLYTSIPTQEAIINIRNRLKPNSTYFRLTIDDIDNLLTVILHNTYFTFQSRVYLQHEGLPMGSSLSGLLAILSMDTIERSALTTYQPAVTLYKRYVDDAYSQAGNEQQALRFHHHMNQQHPKIKFEIEKPTPTENGWSLSLLDFNVTITNQGETEFEFYRKEAKKPLFTHYNTHLPKATKIQIASNETRRINNRCSSEESKQKHNSNFDKVLRTNQYPQRVIDQTKRHVPTKHSHRSTPNWLYLRIPYISDAIDRKIKRIFKDEEVPIRVIHKSTSLRQILAPRNRHEACNRTKFPIANDKICNLRGVVYKIRCNQCHKTYIGSTIRKLHDRIKEHMDKSESSVFRHLSETHNGSNDISTTIIARDNDVVLLRLNEAYFIRKEKPQLNSREESSELADLMF